jgi:hypothetical protein
MEEVREQLDTVDHARARAGEHRVRVDGEDAALLTGRRPEEMCREVERDDLRERASCV